MKITNQKQQNNIPAMLEISLFHAGNISMNSDDKHIVQGLQGYKKVFIEKASLIKGRVKDSWAIEQRHDVVACLCHS